MASGLTGNGVSLVLCWLVPLAVVALIVWLTSLMRDSTYRVAESLDPNRTPSHSTHAARAKPAPIGAVPGGPKPSGDANSVSAESPQR